MLRQGTSDTVRRRGGLERQGNYAHDSCATRRCSRCFDKALAIDPLYPRALFGKAAREDALAVGVKLQIFSKYIEVASPEDAELIAAAGSGFQELRASLN